MEHTYSVTLPLVTSFGDAVDIPDAVLAAACASGTHPRIVRAGFDGVVDDTSMAALGYDAICSDDHPGEDVTRTAYRNKDGSVLVLVVCDGTNARVAVAAGERSVALDEVEAIEQRCKVEPTATADDSVLVSFRWYGQMGVSSSAREVAGPSWEQIRSNYPAATRSSLDALAAVRPESRPAGRLILFHGAPGTGKTTAVRALGRSWSDWCDTSCIVDPEILFGSSEYLYKMVLDGSDRGRRRRHAREGATHLIIAEDVDELVKADARDRTGQALSRLLNISDGILGHGLDVVFLLTTNEPLGSLHPAISRPGRCLANIEFGRFTAAEARAWLGSDAAYNGGEATLAELYARRTTGVIAGGGGDERISGIYL